ncbi:MAG: hypothetical protein JST17_06550 [Bacteroidetes bacterium]|nr:hypothetical protein [Bacteroidota bacterium]MBS1929781.1 hypothetical protein [Bacteroidota bacterium]
MKKPLSFFFCFAFMIQVKAQKDKIDVAYASGKISVNRSIYGEGGGGGIIFSANYDSRFPGAENVGYRVGLGFFPSLNNFVVTIPVGLYYLLGNAPNYFEMEVTTAVGTSEVNFKNHKSNFFLYPHIGYHYNKNTKGFFFKIEVGPLFIAGKVYPFPGIGFGYTLEKLLKKFLSITCS